MGGHGLDWDLVRRWKKPVFGLIGIHVAMVAVLAEDYMFWYHNSKGQWAYYKQHRGHGLLPPYQVKYSQDRVDNKNIEVVWESFRPDVE